MGKETTEVIQEVARELEQLDHISTSRTVLASERTLLAYIRTGLTAIIVGVTMIKLFDSDLIRLMGWMFIPGGIGLMLVGLARHKKRKIRIRYQEAHAGTK